MQIKLPRKLVCSAQLWISVILVVLAMIFSLTAPIITLTTDRGFGNDITNFIEDELDLNLGDYDFNEEGLDISTTKLIGSITMLIDIIGAIDDPLAQAELQMQLTSDEAKEDLVTVAGLESNGKYKTDLQQVLLIPSDNGGLLKSVIVRTVDENGSVLKEIINLTGDQLDEAIAAGQISFNLEEGVRQHVQIICEDYAGNISGSEEEEKFTNITVSTNAFVIFWATEWLRWTTIIIATLLIALIVFVIVKKRKKA